MRFGNEIWLQKTSSLPKLAMTVLHWSNLIVNPILMVILYLTKIQISNQEEISWRTRIFGLIILLNELMQDPHKLCLLLSNLQRKFQRKLHRLNLQRKLQRKYLMMVWAEAQMSDLGGNVVSPTTNVILVVNKYHQELGAPVLSGFDAVRGWLCVVTLATRWSWEMR